MKYYRIEPVENDIRKIFIPRLPDTVSKGENTFIPRICVAPSIEQCILAAPYTYGGDRDACEGKMFRVYEFHDYKYSDESIKVMTPDEVFGTYESGTCLDVFDTEEYWIIEEVKPAVTYLIRNINNNNGMGISYQKIQ